MGRQGWEGWRVGEPRAGEPHSVRVSEDGGSVVFLRSGGPESPVDQLWALDVDTGLERSLYAGDTGVRGYAMAGGVVASAVDGRLVLVDLAGPAGGIEIETSADAPVDARVIDPRPDPTGRRVAYVAASALYVVDRASGRTALLAGEAENPEVAWGRPEPVAAQEFGLDRGFWWSPDGTCVLATRVDATRSPEHIATEDEATEDETAGHAAAGHEAIDAGGRATMPPAGTANAEVSLHLLDLDGGWVDVHWDRETYPYLVSVSWSEVGGPLVTVLRRLQQHGLVLAVDPRTGETQVHAELADPRWVGPVPGSPCYLPDGRVLIGGELAHDGYDARCLFADGGLLTPPSLYVRRVCGRLGPDLLIEASDGEPSEQHLYRVVTRSLAAPTEATRMTGDPGWHTGACAADTVAIGSSSLDLDGTVWTVTSRGVVVGRLRTYAAPTRSAPRPSLERVTDRRLPAGVLYPPAHAGGRLPVLVDISGAPGHQEVIAVRAAWLERQWWAEHGFAVVVVDNRGTPGVAPSFEKVIHRRITDVVLSDQVDGLHALSEKHPDLDLNRVAIRGRGFGGWLAAMGLLRRPETYRCAIAIEPITDWGRLPTAYAERYLGLPADAGDIYAHASLLAAAAEPLGRADEHHPLLVEAPATNGAADALTAVLDRTGRPYERIGSAALAAELAFLRAALS